MTTPRPDAPKAQSRHLCAWLMALLAFVFLTAAWLEPGNPLIFDSEPPHDFNEGWVQVSEEGVQSGPLILPAQVKTDGVLRVSNTVPENLPQPMVLGFRTAHQRVRLYCGGELLYTFGYDQPSRFGHSPGSAWNLVRLPQTSPGKQLLLELDACYPSYQGRLETFQIGSKASLVLSILSRHVFSLLVNLGIFGAGVVMLLTYLLVIRKDSTVSREMLYLGLFSVFVAVWLFGESRLIQFFAIPPAFNTCLTFLAMEATPIPLIKYIACGRTPAGRKKMRIGVWLLSGMFVVSIALQVFGILDFIQQLPLLHGCILIACGVMLYIVIGDVLRRPDPTVKRLAFSLGVLVLFIVLETVRLYTFTHMVGGFVRLGVLLFIAIQAQTAFKNATNMMRLSRLASVDALTGCLNRTAYSQALSELEGREGVGVMIADINDLKLINDTYGHDMGDDAIVRCALAFSEAFSPLGSCFRIGGDEFAMLGSGLTQAAFDEAVIRFRALVKIHAQETAYPFSVSCGSNIYDSKQEKDLSDAVRRADKLMYLNKRQFKQTVQNPTQE